VIFRVELSNDARRYMRRCDPKMRERLDTRLRQLAINPYATSKLLEGGSGLRRSRVGDIRILFEMDLDIGQVYIAFIGPRGDIYKGL